MLSENIKAIRKSNGLSQEELAVRLNVVRQTISKWEQGLSVPDSDVLISLSEALDTPVSVLLGETVAESRPDDIRAIAEKLEIINLQLAQRKLARQRALHWTFFAVGVVIIAVSAVLLAAGSPYLAWNYDDPETVVVGVSLHAFEWIYVRVAPIVFVGAVAGFIATRRRQS